MHFAPDGQSLVCDYCTRHQPLQANTGAYENLPEQKDFMLAMATARGHGKPLAEQVFHCQGCGAQFILPPEQMSITCPYCASPHVVGFEKSPDLLAPDGIIPHAFDPAHASELLAAWLKIPGPASLEVRNPPRALYLPMWVFDVGGAIDYTGEVVEQQDMALGRRAPRLVRISDSYPVMLSRFPIPASRKLSAGLVHLLLTFDLKAMRTYDPRYLAEWPAELYDIPMAEASLDARSQGYAMLKRDMQTRLAPMHLISASSARVTIESFGLDLLPVWVTEVIAPAGDGSSSLLLINGQTGDIWCGMAPKPAHSGKMLSWLSDLI